MYKDIDEAIKKERIKAEYLKEQINSPEPGIKASKCLEMAEEHEQLAEWLEELKELRELKDTYAKGMETSYSEFRYKQGRAEGYSKAENDYFAQSQKDREDTYNCGYAIGRADAEEEVENRFNNVLDDEKRISYQQGRQDALQPIIKFIDDYDGAICISESMGVISGQQLINELKEIVEQLKENNK